MILMVALVFRFLVRGRIIEAAREQAEKGLAGSMEGHASMDMSIDGDASFVRRIFSPRGLTSVSHIFVMEWAAVLRDIVIGLLIAGAVSAWVPEAFWRELFLSDHVVLSKVWGPLVGPVIAVLSFVCSIGNVPLAGVLWNGGISFGGVVSFLFADLIIVPILVIYRKYYGTKMMLILLGVFYATMVTAGYLVEALFAVLDLVARGPRRQGDGPGHLVELHDLAQHGVPAAGAHPGRALLPHRWAPDDVDDGRLARGVEDLMTNPDTPATVAAIRLPDGGGLIATTR